MTQRRAKVMRRTFDQHILALITADTEQAEPTPEPAPVLT